MSLHKLAGGLWDVVGSDADGKKVGMSADLAAVSDVLNKLSKVKARSFISDSATDVSKYGIGPNSLRISVKRDDGAMDTIQIGAEYDNAGEPLMYAKTGSGSAVYGISKELAEAASTDILKYRSKVLWTLPEKASVASIKIVRVSDSSTIFEIGATAGRGFVESVKALPSREAAAVGEIASCAKMFTVSRYLPLKFSQKGVEVDGKKYAWAYSVTVAVDLPGAGTTALKTREILLTERVGGTTQYGGIKADDAVFVPSQGLIDAVFEIISNASEPAELKKTPPLPPTK